MREIEVEGKTVTIAVENGLSEMGLRRDQVEVEVLDQGSPGFLGIGTKLARVRIREKHWAAPGEAEDEGPQPGNTIEPARSRPEVDGNRAPQPGRSQRPPRERGPRPERRGDDSRQRPRRPRYEDRPSSRQPSREPAPERTKTPRPEEKLSEADVAKVLETSQAVLKEILSLAGLGEASIQTSWDPEQNRAKAEVQTPDAGLLIGKAGHTLEALQFLVTIIVGRKTGVSTAIQVECEGYWKKVEERIMRDVARAVDDVKRTQRPFRLEPMEPALRRLVHRKLVSDPEVETASEGEGPWRKVVIRPRAKPTAA